MSKKLKVLFVAEDFYPNFIGGGGVYGYHLVEGLSKNSDVTVLAEERTGRVQFWENKNINLILTPFCFGNQLILALMQYLIFKIKLSGKQFDVVHATQLSGLLFVLLKPKNTKVIITPHHTYFDMFKESDSFIKRLLYLPLIVLEKWMYQRADAVIFHTAFERESVKGDYNLKKPVIATIHLGVDLPKITASERNKAQQLVKKKEQIILYVGRLVKRKKVKTLLEALGILYHQGVKVRGLIIGEGRDKENLLKKRPPNVTFLGFVEDTKPYFLSADIFVLTSVSEGGVSLSVFEAASFGLPLIVSSSVDDNLVIKPGKNGYIVEADDAEELALRIKQILPKKTTMGRLSQQYVKRLTWARCAKNTLNFYGDLIERT